METKTTTAVASRWILMATLCVLSCSSAMASIPAEQSCSWRSIAVGDDAVSLSLFDGIDVQAQGVTDISAASREQVFLLDATRTKVLVLLTGDRGSLIGSFRASQGLQMLAITTAYGGFYALAESSAEGRPIRLLTLPLPSIFEKLTYTGPLDVELQEANSDDSHANEILLFLLTKASLPAAMTDSGGLTSKGRIAIATQKGYESLRVERAGLRDFTLRRLSASKTSTALSLPTGAMEPSINLAGKYEFKFLLPIVGIRGKRLDQGSYLWIEVDIQDQDEYAQLYFQTFLLRFDPKGALYSWYYIANSTSKRRTGKTGYETVVQSVVPKYSISPEGHVFSVRLSPKRDRYEICVLEPRKVGDLASWQHPSIKPPPTRRYTADAELQSLSRDEIESDVTRWLSLKWDAREENLDLNVPVHMCASDKRLTPPYLRNARVGDQVVGVPYAWGCKYGLDEVKSDLLSGKSAGDVCTLRKEGGGCRPNVTGVDCSGFVARIWRLNAEGVGGTSHFYQRFPKVRFDQLCYGDALVKPDSHIVIFREFNLDDPAAPKISVIDASVRPGKVNTRELPFREFLGYFPIRRPNLQAADGVVDAKCSSPSQILEQSVRPAESDRRAGRSGRTVSAVSAR